MSSTPDSPIPLREPANQVSPKAIGYWRMAALFRWLLLLGALAVLRSVGLAVLRNLGLASDAATGPVTIAAGVIAGMALIWSLVVPRWRYDIHRWELTPEALFTQSGWLTRTLRIAPLSRIQTVDTRQTATMRWFGLTSVLAANASSAGPIQIACLDDGTARELVATLTAITAASEGDGA